VREPDPTTDPSTPERGQRPLDDDRSGDR
jgi:hypothetical protein